MKFPTDDNGILTQDPRGAQVTMTHEGRTLLGDVTSIRMTEEDGERIRVLQVRHFNGQPWPVEPYFLTVDVLERTYSPVED